MTCERSPRVSPPIQHSQIHLNDYCPPFQSLSLHGAAKRLNHLSAPPVAWSNVDEQHLILAMINYLG